MTADQMADAFITALPTIVRIAERSPKADTSKGSTERVTSAISSRSGCVRGLLATGLALD
jgi:hypothetical protein